MFFLVFNGGPKKRFRFLKASGLDQELGQCGNRIGVRPQLDRLLASALLDSPSAQCASPSAFQASALFGSNELQNSAIPPRHCVRVSPESAPPDDAQLRCRDSIQQPHGSPPEPERVVLSPLGFWLAPSAV